MHEAITVGEVVWTIAIIVGVLVVIGGFVAFLSILANAFKD